MHTSQHLQNIIDRNNQLSYMQVVFVDIEKYSLRKTPSQVTIINEFTNCLQTGLKEVAQFFIEYTQQNNINIKTDVIIIPTGDGAAVIFPFEGLHNIHIKFAECIMKHIYENNQKGERCLKFENNGWCNCHNKFNVRIGISEGKGIVYKDINNNFNVAGNVINISARLLSQAERNQIILSEYAYKEFIDLDMGKDLTDNFIELRNVNIKHDVKINIYIYKSENKYINSNIPDKYKAKELLENLKQKIQTSGIPLPFLSTDNGEFNKKQALNTMAEIKNVMGSLLDIMEVVNDQNKTVDTNEVGIMEVEKKKTRRSTKK